jgi:hypothetical protein
MLDPSAVEAYLRQLPPEQLRAALAGFLPQNATATERISAIETALLSPAGRSLRAAMARWVVEHIVPVEALVPKAYVKWRPPVRDAMSFVVSRLSAPRLAPKLLEQIELPPKTSPETRLLLLIANRPRAIAFSELLNEARARVKGNSNSRERDAEVLGVNLLRAFTYSGTLVDLHTYVPPVTSQPSERPIASRVARYQAPSMDRVTNAYHERIKLEPFGIFLTPYLDGTRDRAALIDLLLNGPIARGELSVQREGQAVTDPQGIRSALADEVDELLRWLAFAGVLIG